MRNIDPAFCPIKLQHSKEQGYKYSINFLVGWLRVRAMYMYTNILCGLLSYQILSLQYSTVMALKELLIQLYIITFLLAPGFFSGS